MKWTDQNDARLLVAIITTTQSKINWKAVAEFMGEDCTASAVQHRVQRLKEMAAKMGPPGQGDGSSGKDSPDGSPAKRGRGRPKKGALIESPSKKIKSVGDEGENEEDKVKVEMEVKLEMAYDEDM